MTNDLPRDVQLQFMRPEELAAAASRFPVVYVPMGPIEWHGKHLPLGTDALKAHGIAVKTAELFGGVVYPPIYFHNGFNRGHLTPLLTELFHKLRSTGFRVIIGISGHNVQGMIDMIEEGLAPVLSRDGMAKHEQQDRLLRPVSEGDVAGTGIWEMSLTDSDESGSDHAAKWESSDMMFFYPESVDLSALGDEEIVLDMRAPWGIGGLDPRTHASVEAGRRNVELCAQSIGAKAKELLAALPEDKRDFDQTIEPSKWWMI